ncbi:MAG: 3-phosphoglycerate dehydrogenase family protein [Clostridiales bacterium]|nr:3-phosphoglycerate dehydrogenase family protein [Clostridiales bacterium]
MYKIGTFNKISPVGLGKLTDDFALVEDQNEANGIILRSYDMHEMDFSDNLLAIGRAGAGTNNIPVDRCAQQGIVVFNSPGANANAVKELCLAGMIMAARNIPAGIAWAKTLVGSEGVGKQIEKGKGQFAGTEILGKTLGVIGLGAIGRLVANACVGLGMTVVGYDAFLSDKAKSELDPSITVVDDLNALYPQCDYISIHVPANDSTKGMMNAVAFAQMKDGVKFMNFSRDKLMNDDDLLAALDSGKISTYVTDFADDAILNADKPNIIVLPHLGASSAEAEDNCASMAVTQVMDYLENGNIVNSVNMPAVSLGARKGTRVSVIAKADAAAAVLAKVAELGAADVASATRGDYAYILAEVEADEAAIAIDGVIRARILK